MTHGPQRACAVPKGARGTLPCQGLPAHRGWGGPGTGTRSFLAPREPHGSRPIAPRPPGATSGCPNPAASGGEGGPGHARGVPPPAPAHGKMLKSPGRILPRRLGVVQQPPAPAAVFLPTAGRRGDRSSPPSEGGRALRTPGGPSPARQGRAAHAQASPWQPPAPSLAPSRGRGCGHRTPPKTPASPSGSHLLLFALAPSPSPKLRCT